MMKPTIIAGMATHEKRFTKKELETTNEPSCQIQDSKNPPYQQKEREEIIKKLLNEHFKVFDRLAEI